MSAFFALAALLAATPPLVEAPILPCPRYAEDENVIPVGRRRVEGREQPPYGDALGDVWEMEEVSCWRGTWLRRGKSNVFDAYWKNPNGERERATLKMWLMGRDVTVIRRHDRGRYCRYDGRISTDWWSVQGWYSCTWHLEKMQWHGRIVRLTRD
jgi:hypothetical protein